MRSAYGETDCQIHEKGCQLLPVCGLSDALLRFRQEFPSLLLLRRENRTLAAACYKTHFVRLAMAAAGGGGCLTIVINYTLRHAGYSFQPPDAESDYSGYPKDSTKVRKKATIWTLFFGDFAPVGCGVSDM